MGTAHRHLVVDGPRAVVEGAPRSALVTGPTGAVAAASQALKERGFDLFWAGELGWLNETALLLERSSVSCYVQLPTGDRGGGTSELSGLIFGSLLPRFAAAAAVMPILRPGASVVLVAGEVTDPEAPDDQGIRLGLLRTLARTITADRTDIRVIVVGRPRTYEEVAEIAHRGRISVTPRPEISADHAPELDFSSWRQEIVSFIEADPAGSMIIEL